MYPNVVLNTVGFWLPFLLATNIVIYLGLIIRRGRLTRSGLARYFGLVLGTCSLSVVLFHYSPDPINLPLGWTLEMLVLATFAYGAFFFMGRTIAESIFECYAVGTFSMILSDFARSYIFPINLATVYWGGKATGDLIFQFGYLMAILYVPAALFIALGYSVLKRKNLVIEKVLGKRALDWLLRKFPQRIH